MTIKKIVLGTLDRVYATTIMPIHDRLHFIVASEGRDGACIAFSEGDFKPTTIWEKPGGTMGMVPIPGLSNQFIASQQFFPTFDSKESRIVHVISDSPGYWQITPIMQIPYLHRFDLFRYREETYFIGATLCEDKAFKDDWSKPGKVLIGKISSPTNAPELQPVLEGITKNHGFCRTSYQGRDSFFISGVEGVFIIYQEKDPEGRWITEKIMDHEVSDVAIFDIDGDGQEELATIEPFHGEYGQIYRKTGHYWAPIHRHIYEFGHVVWGGLIRSKPSFIIGGRKGNMELLCFQFNSSTKSIESFLIDSTGGPSNIAVWNADDKDYVLAANRQIAEIALYEIY